MEKILVIDDEKATLTMFRLFLDAYGYSVFTAENGAEGLEIFKRERPQIVITDIKMPGVDGLNLMRQMKNIDPAVEVVVITGHGDTDLAKQALDRDAADFINKPIHKEALDAALNKARERLDLSKNQGKV